jgi:hypothetical protein
MKNINYFMVNSWWFLNCSDPESIQNNEFPEETKCNLLYVVNKRREDKVEYNFVFERLSYQMCQDVLVLIQGALNSNNPRYLMISNLKTLAISMLSHWAAVQIPSPCYNKHQTIKRAFAFKTKGSIWNWNFKCNS